MDPLALRQLLAPLGPDESALAGWLRENLDETMLREIAEADYGWKADECFALLKTILESGTATAEDGALREVLELIRWSDPEDPEWGPGGHGRRGHAMRLFACASLVQLGARYPSWFEGECETVAQLIASAIELGEPVARAGGSLLAWRFLTYPGDTSDRPFLAFAVLLLSVHLGGNGPWLKSLADWTQAEESRARSTPGFGPWSDEWLLGLTIYREREAVWRSLSRRVLAHPQRPHTSEADEDLRLLGELVGGE